MDSSDSHSHEGDLKLKLLESAHLNKWQNKLMPFLVIAPSALILFFIGLATWQMHTFNNTAAAHYSKSVRDFMVMPGDEKHGNQLENNFEYLRWATLAELEEQSISRRYHQGSLLLMSRIFVKYLGFLTGMIMAIVGSVFIIGKLSESNSDIEGSISEHIRLKVISSSPGVIFGILGTVLMLATVLKHNDVEVGDSPLFLNAYSLSTFSKLQHKENLPLDIDPNKARSIFGTDTSETITPP